MHRTLRPPKSFTARRSAFGKESLGLCQRAQALLRELVALAQPRGFYFQIPGLPERITALNDWSVLRRALTTTSREGTFSDEDLARYQAAWSQPGAIKGMLNHYRAGMRAAFPTPDRIAPRTLVLWGGRDAFLREELAHRSMEFCDQGRLVLEPDASHWLQHEIPDRVNRALVEFLRER